MVKKTKWFELTKEGIKGYGLGAKIQLSVDRDGAPLDSFWRKRYLDNDTLKPWSEPKKPVKVENLKDKIEKKEDKK